MEWIAINQVRSKTGPIPRRQGSAVAKGGERERRSSEEGKTVSLDRLRLMTFSFSLF